MTNEQLIEKFNPANGPLLTAEDLVMMRELTDEQINVLAEAYPNQPTRRSYLRLYDKQLPEDKQLYQLSTWQNLRNVRKFSAKKNLVAYDFFKVGSMPAAVKKTAVPAKSSPKKVVVDLSAQEAAAELKKNLVDKPAKTSPAKASTNKPKAAAGKASGGKKKSDTAQQSGVENTSLPPDEQFTDAQ